MRRSAAVFLAVTCLWSCTGAASGALERTAVYVTNWAQYFPDGCRRTPKDMPANLATHVHYAFAFLNPDLSPKPMEYNDLELYKQVRGMKLRNPKLKTLVAIGGWTMNLNGSGYEHLFSQAVATKSNRTKFIRSAMQFCNQHGFDGLEIDWEYPGDVSRGGRKGDKAGFAKLMQEFRATINAFGRRFLLSFSGAGGPGGYEGLDLPNLHPYVDSISIMTYDYHGSWENFTNYHTPWRGPQDGLGIQETLHHYINVSGVPPSKINLGMALYGRSWTLADAAQNGVGAKAIAPGRPGNCTNEAGFLAWREVKAMKDGGAQVTVGKGLRAAYLLQDDQWVSFDTPRTLTWKMQAAAEMGLGGTMVWAMDLDDADFSMLKLIKQNSKAAAGL